MNELSVLITGASSGIGKACTDLLSRKGFCVFAGVRSKNDGDALQEATSGNVTPVVFDVTNHESISNAIRIISKSTRSNLFALINNAGIAFGGPLEILPLSEMQKLIDVNVVGVCCGEWWRGRQEGGWRQERRRGSGRQPTGGGISKRDAGCGLFMKKIPI